MKYLLLSLIIILSTSCLYTYNNKKKGPVAPPITVSSVNISKTQGLHFGENATIVTVHNPFPINVGLELKCNWNKTEQRWTHWHYWTLLKYQNIKILIPAKSKCQIWPNRSR